MEAVSLGTRKMGGAMFPRNFVTISGREFCGSRYSWLFRRTAGRLLATDRDVGRNVNMPDTQTKPSMPHSLRRQIVGLPATVASPNTVLSRGWNLHVDSRPRVWNLECVECVYGAIRLAFVGCFGSAGARGARGVASRSAAYKHCAGAKLRQSGSKTLGSQIGLVRGAWK